MVSEKRAIFDAQFGSGLREEYDFNILKASFGYDLGYQNGQQLLLILEGFDEEEEEAREILSMGSGWESTDGITATHPHKAKPNNRSTFSRWCAYAADSIEAKGQDWLLDKDVLDSTIWNDTKWHLQEKEIVPAFTPRGESQERPATIRRMPVEFLGFIKDDGKAGAEVIQPSENPPTEPPPQTLQPTVQPTLQSTPSNGSLESTLTALARSSADFGTFISAAMQLPNIQTDEQLASSVIDGSSSGYYATHHQ